MKYMGGKTKISKHILPVMLAERRPGQYWVEPFVGGANVIDKVAGPRIGNDSHEYLIELLKAVQNGWIPPTKVSRKAYYQVKENQHLYKKRLVGFVGFLCSFGGKWWGGYASSGIKCRYADGSRRTRNYAGEGSRAAVKQAAKLKGIDFRQGDYLGLSIPLNSLIYCDPPYEGTTKYDESIDHKVFWEWCRVKSKEGHTVFVSEYNAPKDFECILEIPSKTKLNLDFNSQRIEKLFKYRSTR